MRTSRSTRFAILVVAALTFPPQVGLEAAVAPPPADPLWVSAFARTSSVGRFANAIAVSAEGERVFVVGEEDIDGQGDYLTIAFAAGSGARVWRRRYDGPSHRWDSASAVGVNPDGTTVFVTGSSDGGPERYDVATIAYDAIDGHRLWVSRYRGPPGRDAGGFELVVGPGGNRVYVAGEVNAGEGSDYLTLAYGARTGSLRWARRYDGPAPAQGSDELRGLALSPDGRVVVVTGTSPDPATGQDYLTIAYEADTGNVRWKRRFDAGTGDDEGPGDNAAGVAATADRVVVTGTSWHALSADYLTVAYGLGSGRLAWVRRYDGGESDHSARAIAAAPDGTQVFVTGTLKRLADPSYDFGTIAYDARTGVRTWVSRFDSPMPGWDYDVPTALAVSPDGAWVVVVGDGGDDEVSGSVGCTVALDAATGDLGWYGTYDDIAGTMGNPLTGVAIAPDGTRVFVSEQRAALAYAMP